MRFEAATTPSAREVIEDKCLSCHAPQQQYPLRATGARARLEALNSLGEEGVACAVCHQVTDQGLGARQSFTAGFEINTQKLIFGPHAEPFAMPMRANSGYIPTFGVHLAESSLCASCHTVITPTLTAAGQVVSEIIEQGPYLEWLRSAYPGEGTSCQSCHMPTLKDDQGRSPPQYIAHTPGGGRFGPTAPRAPFGMHFFSGGKVQILGMLKELYP